jgi:cell division septal protein FtsQ
MKRRTRRIVLAAVGIVAASSPFWGPPLLRVSPGFDTRRVEVSGTRLLAPHEVLAASGVKIGGSVWTDPAGWEAGPAPPPRRRRGEVTRRLPNTLRIRVTEKRAAALVQAGTLRPVTAEGEVLPWTRRECRWTSRSCGPRRSRTRAAASPPARCARCWRRPDAWASWTLP